MIKIEIPDEVKKLHKKFYHSRVKKALKSAIRSTQSTVARNIYSFLLDKHQKDGILTAMPKDLWGLIVQIQERFAEADIDKCNETLLNVFNYEQFGTGCSTKGTPYHEQYPQWNAYAFIKALKVTACPYCNGNFLLQIDIYSKKIRPALDHFFPHKKFPYLGISLYNLVPSCDICNSKFKLASELDFEKYLHPYCDSFHDAMTFCWLPNANSATPHVFLLQKNTSSGKAYENSRLFHLNEIYNHVHADTVRHLVYLREAYPRRLIKDHCRKLGCSKQNALKTLFNYDLTEEKINQQVLGKLTCDILKDLLDD